MPIEYKIEKKNFETIGDQLGAIITEELAYQKSEYDNPDCDCVDVYRERTSRIDSTEMSVVNVSYASTEFSNKNQGSKTGDSTYFIDVYASSKSTRTEDGDKLANLKLQRIMGIIDEIIENPIYKKLGFTTPAISGHMVENMEIIYPRADEADALSNCFGRLTVKVRANETTGLLNGTPLTSAITQVKLGLTDKGYRYEYAEE